MKSLVIIVFFVIPITKYNVKDRQLIEEHVSKANKPCSRHHFFNEPKHISNIQTFWPYFSIPFSGWWRRCLMVGANTSSSGGSVAAEPGWQLLFWSEPGPGPGSHCSHWWPLAPDVPELLSNRGQAPGARWCQDTRTHTTATGHSLLNTSY